MDYTKKDEVRVYGGRIGIIDDVIYWQMNGKITDWVYCYEMTIDGISGYLVYPDEIEQ